MTRLQGLIGMYVFKQCFQSCVSLFIEWNFIIFCSFGILAICYIWKIVTNNVCVKLTGLES